MCNPGDQAVRKPYFWSHNLIFGHHLRTGSFLASSTRKFFPYSGIKNLVIRLRLFFGDQISPIWSSDLVSEQKYQIDWYNNSVQGSVAWNQLSCCNNNKNLFSPFFTQYSMGKLFYFHDKHSDCPTPVPTNGICWRERPASFISYDR
jgi:hypothetical protein